jgi:hypothetical protein
MIIDKLTDLFKIKINKLKTNTMDKAIESTGNILTFNLESLKRAISSSLGLVALTAFGYFQAVEHLIPQMAEFLQAKQGILDLNYMRLIWPPIIAFGLITMWFILLIRIFKPVKGMSEKGLISYLYKESKKYLFGSLSLGFVFGMAFWLDFNEKKSLFLFINSITYLTITTTFLLFVWGVAVESLSWAFKK